VQHSVDPVERGEEELMALPESREPSDQEEQAVEASSNGPEETPTRQEEVARERNPVKRILALLGPGLIAGASDDDPTAIATFSNAGAAFGYSTLWTALVTFPMMATVQFVCAKVALVSGTGLGEALRRHYPARLVYAALSALVIANTVNAGADIGAIAAAVTLLVPIPVAAMIVPVTLLILALLIWGSYNTISSIFKWLALLLLTYIVAALLARPDPIAVLRGTFIPSFSLDRTFLLILVAILGTNISPYLFFWQASEEVEEHGGPRNRRLWRRRGEAEAELRYAAMDTDVGMFFSNVVVYFINLAAAATLHDAGVTHVQSAADAAAALRPLAGDLATVLFALGLVGSGFLAVPVLAASSAYALSEAFGWRRGLGQAPRLATRFYGVIVASMVVGMMINFVGINPLDALVWSAALNGLLAPLLLVMIMLISNNRQVMNNHVNGAVTNLIGWATTATMFAAAIALILTWARS
jgi:NRAMP (natural resistance-associated macrophage protein)-like metal ion transporter